ncbi:hypothetical protein F2Q68_00016911 [Brassica cretica]|uniref:Uncharacterized protein n=1 Tax=Brassica cretica TaxID=69181 RepID=A0A8S9HJ33_BRACR|nr:hypothetical protein F2Q68_00016911 [Brassica cretica]
MAKIMQIELAFQWKWFQVILSCNGGVMIDLLEAYQPLDEQPGLDQLGFPYPGARRGRWTRNGTRVGGRGFPYPSGRGRHGSTTHRGLLAMASTRVASLPRPKINIFKGHFKLF